MKEVFSSLYSDSTKHYVSNPYPNKGDKITIKLRLKENDLIKKIFLRYKKQGVEILEEMTVLETKQGLVYYQAQAHCLDHKLSYLFYLLTDDCIYYYNQKAVYDYMPDESHNFQLYTDYQAPAWLAQTCFYQIMTDRFHNGRPDLTYGEDAFTYNGHQPRQMAWGQAPLEYEEVHAMDFYGGDLWGIIEKLDYLQDLGINGLYLNPIFTSPTHHKYDALDYFSIDPSLGGEEALIALSEELHARGMRLILDISINHTSSAAKWFNKTCEFYDKSIGAYHNPLAAERNSYFIKEDGSYSSWFGVDSMPQLNYSSQDLRDIIYRNEDSVLKRYLKEPFNIDGWRFDVADVMARNEELDLYHEIWREIYQEIKATKADAAIIAEEWSDTWEMYDSEQWDSTMNYFQAARPLREFAGTCDLFLARHADLAAMPYAKGARQLGNRILQFFDKVPSQIQYQMFNLINSHDIARLYHEEGTSLSDYLGASRMLFGLPGAVSIWYGDEKLLDGHHRSMEGSRYPMDWSSNLAQDKAHVFQQYRQLCQLKSTNTALHWGAFKILNMSGQLFAFCRFTDQEAPLFIWSKEEVTVSIQVDLSDFGLQDSNISCLQGQMDWQKVGVELKLEIPSRESGILSIRLKGYNE